MSSSLFKNKFPLRLASVLILLSLAFSFLPPTAQAQTIPEKTRELTPEEKPFKEQKRLALVIGNAKYEHISGLNNAANDATDISAALKELGFDVMSGIDQSKQQMEVLIREFGVKLGKQGGVGLFFYAGHGVQYGSRNYLIPVDADIPVEDEIEYKAVNVGLLMNKFSTAKNDLNIVFLDACRNNPFAKSWSEYRDVGQDSGVGKISAPKGTILIYATEPGNVASDGSGRNGLFTEALLEQIKQPDVELNDLYRKVGRIVSEKSKQKQRPYMEGTNFNDFYFARIPDKSKPAASTNASAPVVKPPVAEKDAAEEAEAWLQAKDSTAPEDFRLFLKAFPNGANAATARTRLEKVLWESIKETNDITAVENFLKEFPNGANKTAAQIRLNKLNKARQTTATVTEPPVTPKESAPTESTPKETTPKETTAEETAKIPAPKETVSTPKDSGKTRFQREAEAWSEVSNSTDSQRIRAFLENFPNGTNAENAKTRLEQILWDERRVTKDKALIAELLKEFPNGANAPLARFLLLSLEKQEKDKASNETAPEESPDKTVSFTRTVGGAKKNNPAESKIAARSNIVGMEFVRIPSGSFMMGASTDNITATLTAARKDYADFDRTLLNNEKPARRVTIAQSFWMGKFEVTQAQWAAVMGENPSSFKGCDNCPVERVSWEMAKNFLRRLNELDDGYIYRLPSEAEWEYAARANTLGIFSGRIEEMSWHSGNSEDKTHPVGGKLHNPFGLYDIYGNVSEWCEDIYSPTYEGLPVDGSPNTSIGDGKRRVIRGGHWNSFPTRSRSSFRESHPAKEYATHIGFRVVAVPK